MTKRDSGPAADIEEAQRLALDARQLVEEIAAAAVNVEIAGRKQIGQAKNALEGVIQLSEHQSRP